MAEFDCRDEVFCDRAREVLGSVVQATQMAQPDPFDVDQLHAEARNVFRATLAQVQSGSAGKILLIRGEAGCGKTHLIRSLRGKTHAARNGVVAYVHMTSEQGDYRRYLLRQVVRSLGDPYMSDPAQPQQRSALDLISDTLVETGGLERAAADKLADAEGSILHRLVSDYADAISEDPRFTDVDLNTLRIFLYRQSSRKPIQRRVTSYLNGEPLSDMDWEKLAALPTDCDRGPMHLLGQLARITHATLGSPLIICVDQIEASDITGKNHEPFLRAMNTACELMENVPRLMIVLSCLDSAYDIHTPSLLTSYRFRIENDPRPVDLIAARSTDEIRKILSRRLKWLYEGVGLQHVPPDSVYPLPENVPEQLNRMDLRTVLLEVHSYWQQCNKAGSIVPWQAQAIQAATPASADHVDRIRIAWNDFLTGDDHTIAEDDKTHLELLAWALKQLPDELSERATMLLDAASDTVPRIAMTLNRVGADPLNCLLGLCERDARGNGLHRQITTLESLRNNPGQNLVILRSTRFPARGKVADYTKNMPRIVIDEQQWKTLQALRAFLQTNASLFPLSVVQEWRKSDKPLLVLPAISAIIDRPPAPPTPPTPAVAPAKIQPTTKPQAIRPPAATTTPKPQPRPIAPPPSIQPAWAEPFATGPMLIGKTDSYNPVDVLLDPQALTRHTAIFGASGSGKTVLALSIVEMLLERGISVVLFDRKGDLATYAVEEAWQISTDDAEANHRRGELRRRLDIHLYTPGCETGRPLVLPLLPTDLNQLSDIDREQQARESAGILCDVCHPGPSKSGTYTTVLMRAIDLLCGGNEPRSLGNLQDLLLAAPSELLARLPAHTAKHCEEVGRRLNEQLVTHGRLFSDKGERLDLNQLLLRDSNSGKARLNIISTQFLEPEASLIWVAQFLAEAGRFIRRSPSPTLQALLMFDEADIYIPHTRKPATKPGMENLLKRARGAGVGIMLASQNVSDFDHVALNEMSSAFAGKITTSTALEKLRLRFNDAVQKLPKKSAGQFLMGMESDIRDIKARMCLMKPQTVPRDQIEILARRTREYHTQ
jgi:energy-coupling factor transporter ATP-binding protein EcfA2